MAITPEQLEKLAFMEAPNKHCSASEKFTERYKPVSTTTSFQKVKERSIGKAVYTCRRCSFVLFRDVDLIEHKEYKAQTRLVEGQIEEKGSAENPSCSALFLQQVPWSQDLSNDEGKLSCPKCKCRIGSYTWFGEKCSCGNWVTPSLKIPKRRVDCKIEK
ncbi:protein-tyrosine phosphatase [Galdieria sulphuraria]|uniref:Protein-tyrosine phosphatase n=1 Tax=Galdieria sulphuraria TaxID=130081 RepID=M2Y5Q0_GALSU|nr:protein-tyrosine phosphatase [Galdieria sulphuraria]EME31288.1 protein-tyrosine phosphatase [Galdieria sulphuraria]|eukprot:XP_005707808.1 protein-tyrosine phosphatase [Galdieria sulphuraria]